MNRKINSIMEITDEKETWRIAVRVVNMWNIPRSPKYTIEMILMDDKGDKIVGQFKNVDPKKCEDSVKVGATYIIQNFEVENNTGHFRASNHAFKLSFVKGTKIKEHDLPDIPKNVFNFTLFDDVINGSACPDYLIDVIGELVEIVQWHLEGKPKKVVFTLKDQCATVISCTLWEGFALQLKEYLDKHEDGPVIILLHLAKIKERKGNYPLSIQNSMYGSKLFINEDMKEIDDFKNSLEPSQMSIIPFSQRMSQMTHSSQISNEDKFMYKAEVKSLSQLCELKKECFCVTVATISKLLVANGWVYEGCPKCNKKVDSVDKSYTCDGCGNESSTTVARFRVEVRVSQPNETACFVLFDRECNILIKETASEIKQKMIDEAGEFDPKDYPDAIDRMLGKKLAFRFKVVPSNIRFSVSQISEDEDVINSILKKLLVIEVISNAKKEISCSSIQKNDDMGDSQCFSATAESDPYNVQSATPAKRLSSQSDSELEAIPFEDLNSIQLSSSRMSKHIKCE